MMAALIYLIAFSCTGMAAVLLLQAWKRSVQQVELGRLFSLLSAPQKGAIKSGAVYWPGFLAHRFIRAGWAPTRRTAMASAFGLMLVAFLSWAAAGPLAAFLVGISLPLMGLAMLEYRAAIRIHKLSECMLGFIERVRQLLIIGNSLAVSLERATANSPTIVKDYLTPALRRIANGAGVADSIELSATELRLYELHLLATAARTNLRFGGSLTATLKNIIENIRRRGSIERELRGNTSQIRASAWVLGLLPLLVATLVTLSNPGYAHWFIATAPGKRMMLYAAMSQMAGVLCMRAIIRTRY
jgi:tight adherence protein B